MTNYDPTTSTSKCNILICDDIEKDANELATMLARHDFKFQTSIFTCPNKAFGYVSSGAPVDLCFLDIIMPETNGIELAEKLRATNFKGEIVFLTSSNNFAQQSYNVRAFDYLLKPITCESVKNLMNALQNFWTETDKRGLFAKTHGATKFIPFRNISYVEANDHYMNINLLDNSIIEVHATLSEITEQLLSDSRFVKCHRSYIVNLNEIITIKKDDVIVGNSIKIPISKGYLHVKDKINKWAFQRKKSISV
jgi:DNA-binding LytR/AlgR family response regulator